MSPELKWLLSRVGRHIRLLFKSGAEYDVSELEKRWAERGRKRGKLLGYAS